MGTGSISLGFLMAESYSRPLLLSKKFSAIQWVKFTLLGFLSVYEMGLESVAGLMATLTL